MSGPGTCQSGGKTVFLSCTGTARTDGTFVGHIAGKVEGVAEDSAPLTGTFERGDLDLSSHDLEPVHNIRYSGTVRTAP
ncbi:hypothetical protein [Sorangium sp. So ce1182]|uniref:hypothetical protein n=1 Tax=Sorangium sp. So ce1182 TaxID=3133334 RepID=UPI003F5D858E